MHSLNIAIIPARGGSKRIPRKNIKDFCGEPMIAWSIKAAKNAKCFDRIIVSTDDREISEVALDYGVEVPFIRPKSLSDDHTPTIPVIAHAIEWCQQNIAPVHNVCCLYATAPFVMPEDILTAQDLLIKHDADYAFSVTNYSFPIQRAIRINSEGFVGMFNPEYFNVRSQDLEPSYHDAGQFYWGKSAAWLAAKPIFTSKSVPHVLPVYRVQDIDTLDDWVRAELLFKLMKNS